MGYTDAKVHSIAFDGVYSNGNMCSNLGATFDMNVELNFSFESPYNNEPMYIFYDACHMIKLVRNLEKFWEIWGIYLIEKERK